MPLLIRIFLAYLCVAGIASCLVIIFGPDKTKGPVK